LLGTGKVGGLIVNAEGTVSPGTSNPDILDSLGNVTLNAGSTLTIRLDGTNVGVNYDQLRVYGTVTLAGTLNVTAGFVPVVGARFTIIDNDGNDDNAGTFAGLPEGAVLTVNGRPFRISYGDRFGGFGRDVNDVTLEAIPALAVWDGGGGYNRFWSQPLNWVGDIVPMPGDDLQFAHASSASALTTINDFPAGRAVGAMVFVGGHHRAEGNAVQIRGGVRVYSGNETNHPYRSIEVALPLQLVASQSFAVHNTNAVLYLDAMTDLGTYNLTVESHVRYSYVSSDNSQITFRGGVSGQGTMIQTGPGNLSASSRHRAALRPLSMAARFA
jgi:hypothetical protein